MNKTRSVRAWWQSLTPLEQTPGICSGKSSARHTRPTALAGFTLIELLIVIAIIGVLASVVMSNVNSARMKGADAGIIQTLGNMRAAAELYYDQALTYDNMCGDSSVQAAVAKAGQFNGGNDVTCVDGSHVTGEWALEAQLVEDPAQYYCVDHTGESNEYTGSTIDDGAGADPANATCG